jgi:hypothetical protein
MIADEAPSSVAVQSRRGRPKCFVWIKGRAALEMMKLTTADRPQDTTQGFDDKYGAMGANGAQKLPGSCDRHFCDRLKYLKSGGG